jgi:hypothetical protein
MKTIARRTIPNACVAITNNVRVLLCSISYALAPSCAKTREIQATSERLTNHRVGPMLEGSAFNPSSRIQLGVSNG